MVPIQQNLKNFTNHIERNISITCSGREWKADGFLEKFKKRIYFFFSRNQDAHLVSISKCFSLTMDDLERLPVEFDTKNICQRQQFYAEYLKTAKIVKKLLKTSTSTLVCQQLNALAVRVAALKYRIEASNGGEDPAKDIDELLHLRVKGAAEDWKKKQQFIVEHNLSERDLSKIKEVCSYSKFAKQLDKSKHLSEAFFKWVFRNNNGVSQFVQFPGICKRLEDSYLSPRLNVFCGEALSIAKIQKSESPSNVQKELQLPFYDGINTKKISILDESKEITFNEGMKLSIKKIFDAFANKNDDNGDLEFLGVNGIMNWNSRKISPWDPKTMTYSLIDFNDPLWIHKLPLSEVKSKEEINRRYNISMDEGEWLFVYRATRDVADLSLGKRHAFLEFVMPMKDGNYAIYPFGTYMKHFPTGKLKSLASLNSTVLADFLYPDENIYYTHRQHAVVAQKISSDEGTKLLHVIGQDLHRALTNNLIFQMRRENCSYWVQETSNKIDSCKAINPYKVKITQLNSFSFLNKWSQKWQARFITMIDIFLASITELVSRLPVIGKHIHRGITIIENRQRVYKTVSLFPSKEQIFTYQPGWLHEQISTGALPGRVYGGHLT